MPAEALLLSTQERMATNKSPDRATLTNVLQLLVQLYQQSNKPDQVAKWKEALTKVDELRNQIGVLAHTCNNLLNWQTVDVASVVQFPTTQRTVGGGSGASQHIVCKRGQS